MLYKYIPVNILVIFLYMQNTCCMQQINDSNRQTLGQQLTARTLAARARAGQPKTLCEYAEIPALKDAQDEKASLTKALVGKAGWWYKTATLPHKNSIEKIMFDSTGTLIGTMIDNSDDNSDEAPLATCWYLAHIWNHDTAQLTETVPVQAIDINAHDLRETSVQMALVYDSHVHIMGSEGNVAYSIPLDEHTKEVQDVTLYPSHDLVNLQLRNDKSVLWNYKNNKVILCLNARKLICDPKGTLIGSIEGLKAYLRDYSGTMLHALEQRHQTLAQCCNDIPYVRDLAFNPQQDMVATAVSDGACLWDFNGTLLFRLLHLPKKSDTYSMHATFNPQGTLLATAAWDGTVCLWDCNTGELLRTFSNNGSMAAPAFAPQGTNLAMASNNKVHVWQQHEQPTLEQALLWIIIQKWLQTVAAAKKTTEFAHTSEKDIPLWMATQFNLQRDELENVWHTMPETLRIAIFNAITANMAPAQTHNAVITEEDFEYMPDADGAYYASEENEYLSLYGEYYTPNENVDLFL